VSKRPRGSRRPIFIRNAVEASLLDALLEREGIPHYVKAYRDPGFTGPWEFNDAWGQLDCPAEHRDRVNALLEELRKGT
jgi:hypothetical protein